jgi:cell division septal protein FtsQ
MKQKFTLVRALVWIFCSTVFVSALSYLGVKGFRYWKQSTTIDYDTPIQAIVQTGPQKEALKTTYLVELLGLCKDHPTQSQDFDLKQAQKSLLSSPVIKEAEVKFKQPGILYIDYTVRQPLCFLYDFENVALDEEKVPFPVAPFFSPKKLPEIYLGLGEDLLFKEALKGEKIDLAYSLLSLLSGPIVQDLFNIKRIDVSNAFAKSYGQREIILEAEDQLYATRDGREICYRFPRLIRLSTKNYAQELSNYLKLREQLLEKEQQELQRQEDISTKVIDFRIPQLAFIEEN